MSGSCRKGAPAQKGSSAQEGEIFFAESQDKEMIKADRTIQSFFDEDSAEGFVVASDDDAMLQEAEAEALSIERDEFNWVDASDREEFKTVYFNFDGHSIRHDQIDLVKRDIEQAQAILDEARREGVKPVIVIEGHSCHSAGSAAYNLALSEKRAKAVSDWFASAGVPRDHIKIVGRGQEVPVLTEGKKVSGSREEQWPNRRVEVRVVYT